MNDRIHELAKECYVDTGSVHTNHFAYWKFAELIVKECADTIQDFVDHRFPASEYPERLKKYFDIEQ